MTTELYEHDRHQVDEDLRAAGAARHQAEVLAFSQRAAAATDQAALIKEAAETIVRALDAPVYTISELAEGGRQLRRTVGGSDEPATRFSLETMASADAYSLSIDSPVAFDDLVAETRFRDDGLRALGVLSGICIKLSGGNFASRCIGIYDTERHAVSNEVVSFAKIIASMASLSMARIGAEDRLEEVQNLASAMLDSSKSLVLVLDRQQRIMKMNSVCQRIAEFTFDEVKNRPMSNVLVVAEEYEEISARIRQAKNSVEPIEFESHILTKHGERRRVAWSLSATQQGAGGDQSVVMTGICLDEVKAKTQRAFEGDRSADRAGNSPADRFVDINAKPADGSPSSTSARSGGQAPRETGHAKDV